MEFKSTSPSAFWFIASYLVLIVLTPFRTAESRIQNLSEILKFHAKIRNTFHLSVFEYLLKLYPSRNFLIGKAFKQDVLVFEFGVAHGYLASRFLSKKRSRVLAWRGFDLFTGLPRAWRDNAEGTFSNNGEIPLIEDSRVTFIKGAVESTISIDTFKETNENSRFFIFDLDLFEPSLHIWRVLKPHLETGDLVYFDEAFDSDLLELITKYLFNGDISWNLIGLTSTGLLLSKA